jgi:hypothetical protein
MCGGGRSRLDHLGTSAEASSTAQRYCLGQARATSDRGDARTTRRTAGGQAYGLPRARRRRPDYWSRMRSALRSIRLFSLAVRLPAFF